MINIMCRDELLKVLISNEKITLKKTKFLIGKGIRMIQQNRVKSVSIEYDEASILDKNEIAFLLMSSNIELNKLKDSNLYINNGSFCSYTAP